MTTLQINDTRLQLPGRWSELTNAQVVLLASMASVAADRDEWLAKIFLLFTDLKVVMKQSVVVDGKRHYYVKHANTRVFLLPLWVLRDCSMKLSWLLVESEKGSNHYQLRSRLTRNPLPVHGNLYGPGDVLGNVIFEELVRAMIEHRRYHEGNALALPRLIATLWRHERTDGRWPTEPDRREPFADHRIEERVAEVQSMKTEEQMACLLYFEGCLDYVMRKHYHAFGEGDGADEHKPTQAEQADAFMRLINALAQDDPTKAEHVRKSLAWDAIVALDEVARKAEEHKRQLEKMKRK